jgi:hypothetical protein
MDIDTGNNATNVSNASGVAHIHNGGQTFKFKILTQQSFQDKFYVYLPSIIMNMCNAK